jgi:hypothetical protein
MWSTDELTGLGKMVMNFSALDACVDRLLAGFIAESSVAEIIVAGQFVSWKFEKLEVIARECLDDSEAKTALLDWIKASQRLNERRNDMIHSWFIEADTTGSLTRMKASTRGGKWRAESQPIQLDQINELITLVEQGIEVAHSVAQALKETGRWHGELLVLKSSPSPA